LKPVIIQDYNQHMGYVARVTAWQTHYISRRTWKWTKKLFFHLLDLTVLNSYIILHSCGSKLSHRDFRLSLIRDLVQEGGRVLCTQIIQGMPTLSTSRLESKHVLHWLEKGRRQRCRVYSAQKKQSKTIYACPKCNVALCVVPCFKVYHSKFTFWHQQILGEADHTLGKYDLLYVLIFFHNNKILSNISIVRGCRI
jgi:hypothetical protein